MPPQRCWMISAAMDTAVSSGVRAPRSRPTGEARRASPSLVHPGLPQPGEPVGVGPAAAHHPDVRGGGPQRRGEQRHVELRVVGQDADDRARVHRGRGQVGVRPGADDLVRGGEAFPGGEGRTGVAHGHAVAEEGPDPRGGRGMVDGAEDEHAGCGGVRLDEDGDVLHPAFTVRAVPDGAGGSLGEQSARVVGDGGVEPLVAEGTVRPAVADQQPGAPARGSGHHGGERDGLPGGDGADEYPQSFPVRRRDAGPHQDVDRATAGQPGAEGLVVADAVGPQLRPARGEGLRGDLVDIALHAPPGDAARHRARGGHRHRGARGPGRAAPHRDDGGEGEGCTGGQPVAQFRQQLAHVRTPPGPTAPAHEDAPAPARAPQGGVRTVRTPRSARSTA